jgi:hypothetical protein
MFVTYLQECVYVSACWHLFMVTFFASWGGGLDPKGVLELLLGPWRWYTGWDVAQNGLLVDVQNGIG